ncbi:hypothetical protein [Bifidobacterium indicum]
MNQRGGPSRRNDKNGMQADMPGMVGLVPGRPRSPLGGDGCP